MVFRDISKELSDNREQAEFISTASHEMRTPVASIEGYLGLALNPATATIDARAKSFLEKAHENTQHLGQLFQDLLDITKAEDGRLKNEPVVLDATDFSRNIWEGLKPKAEDKGLEYIFMPDHNVAGEKTIMPVFFIHADRDHLHEVLNNLFENAIKYTPSGTVAVNVTGDSDSVRISVKDSGIGIPAEDLPHLFQKFYRVDNSETREINGTGLGLFLSRKLTESIGGKLTVESEYKKGSVFTVRLPRITRENAESLKTKEDAKKSEEHKQIEQKRNQREIDEADRDINAILQDETSESSNKEELTPQIATTPAEPAVSNNVQKNENSQVQSAQAQVVQPVSQPQQSISQPVQVVQQAQRNITQQDFAKYGAIRGFNPLAQKPVQSAQPAVQNVAQPQPQTQPQPQPQPQVQQNYNPQPAQPAQAVQQANPSVVNQNFQQTTSVKTTAQPTLSDIERMKIEYAQKMMAQRQK